MGKGQRPKSDVMALAWAVIDRLLEADVLAQSEQIERAEGRGRMGRIADERRDHAPRACQPQPVSLRPSGSCKGGSKLLQRACQQEIDGVAGHTVDGHRKTRYMSALQDLEAHPNGTWENDIGRETVGRAQRQYPGQSVVGKSKDDKDDQPNSRDPPGQRPASAAAIV